MLPPYYVYVHVYVVIINYYDLNCRLCENNDVKAPSWYFTDIGKTLIITGDGVNRIQDQIEDAKKQHSDLGFNIELVDSKVVTEPLSATVEVVMQGEGWQERRGRCELLLTDTRGREIDLAATSAHVLMTEAEMNHLDTGMLETDSIQQTLDGVTMRYSEGQIKGELGDDSAVQVPLAARPMLGYHIHRHNHHGFMNDIALLPLGANAPQISNPCLFNGILPIKMSTDVNNMIGSIVNARGRRARVIRERRSPRDWKFGYYLSFELEEGSVQFCKANYSITRITIFT